MKNLASLMPVPIKPVNAGDATGWERVEYMVGTVLPDDYKEFVNTYGSGMIGGFVIIWNPFAKNMVLNLIRQQESWLSADDDERDIPFSLHPASDGILPFGATANGDTLFWNKNGLPNDWQILILEARGNLHDLYPFGLNTFLYNLINGEIHGKVMDSGLLENTNFDNTFVEA